MQDPPWIYGRFGLDDLIKWVRQYREAGLGREEIASFFQNVLQLYYSPFFDNHEWDPKILHVLYRLAEFLPEEERRSIPIYPEDDGEIDMPGENEYLSKWHSLEQWMTQWARHRPVPQIQDLLPSGTQLPALLGPPEAAT